MSDRSIVKDLAVTVVSAVAIAGIAMLVEKPASRQLMVMKMAHGARVFCQWQADLWQRLATSSAQMYNRARL